MLWVLGEGANPAKWAFVRNKALVERVLLVAVPGLDAETWRAHRAGLPVLGGRLGEPVTLLAQRADMWQSQSVRALFSVPETRKTKAARTAAAGTAPPPPPPHPPAFYRLTAEQLKICEFPALGEAGQPPPGYITTRPRPASPQPLVALDCEMCETASGFEVTRVSLVDGAGDVLLDELVLPDSPIIEYHTRYSGITAAMLEGVTTRLGDVQARLLAHLAADTLLVGHGLENDLRALRIVHSAVIDTSVLFPHPRGLPSRTALRRLAATFLKKAIQGGEHDSVEDARVALALAQLKFRHGPAYGAEAPDKGEKLCVVLEAAGRGVSLVDRAEALNKVVAGTSEREREKKGGRGRVWLVGGGAGARAERDGGAHARACPPHALGPPVQPSPSPFAIPIPNLSPSKTMHRAGQRAARRDRQGGRGQGRARGRGRRRPLCVDPVGGAGRPAAGPGGGEAGSVGVARPAPVKWGGGRGGGAAPARRERGRGGWARERRRRRPRAVDGRRGRPGRARHGPFPRRRRPGIGRRPVRPGCPRRHPARRPAAQHPAHRGHLPG